MGEITVGNNSCSIGGGLCDKLGEERDWKLKPNWDLTTNQDSKSDYITYYKVIYW